jgi:hypothetical protein
MWGSGLGKAEPRLSFFSIIEDDFAALQQIHL